MTAQKEMLSPAENTLGVPSTGLSEWPLETLLWVSA